MNIIKDKSSGAFTQVFHSVVSKGGDIILKIVGGVAFYVERFSQIMNFHKNAGHKTPLLPQFLRYHHLLWTQGRYDYLYVNWVSLF